MAVWGMCVMATSDALLTAGCATGGAWRSPAGPPPVILGGIQTLVSQAHSPHAPENRPGMTGMFDAY